MPDARFIVKNPKLRKSQDYAGLRKAGLEHITKLGERLWTDHNFHDPGITILELLCYAITDLGHRTGYDVKDLLAPKEPEVADFKYEFHRAREILTCNPVTFDDLRKLLIDIEGVRNAWIEVHKSVVYCLDRGEEKLRICGEPPETGTEANPPVNGLFDVSIEYEDGVPERRVVRVGLPDNSEGSGTFVNPTNRQNIPFHAAHPLIIDAVNVYPEAPGEVVVRLLDTAGNVLAKTNATAAEAQKRVRVELGFEIAPGDYLLDAVGSGVKLYRGVQETFPFEIDNVISLQAPLGGRTGRYFFFYAWEISFAVPPPSQFPQFNGVPVKTVTRADVRLAVLERLHTHRNLCEDFVNVCDLDREEIALCADIEVKASADVEEVLSEIFYRLGKHVAPAVRFYTIQELRDKGKSTDEIFEGPMLDHGFIDDDEFREIRRRCDVRTSDVVRIIMKVDGVVSVKEIALLSFVDGVFRTQESWLLELADDTFRAPYFTAERSKIVFYKNDLPYFANRERVAELVEEKKAADTQSKLSGHEWDLPVPVGEFKDLEDFYPIQNELPATYRVGTIRVPESDSALRKAQSRQLKAYLLFFEQLLANFLSQLAHVRRLFSWSPSESRTYFTQEIREIAGLEDLYIDSEALQSLFSTADLSTTLEKIIETPDGALERRNRFLDHLVARFAEDFTDYSLLMFGALGETASQRLADDKRDFLADYPLLSRNRGQAYDYRLPRVPENISGFQRRAYRLLGIRDVSRRDLAHHGFDVESVEHEGITKWRFVLRSADGSRPFESRLCKSRSAIEALLDFALDQGSVRENYRARSDGTGFRLLVICDETSEAADDEDDEEADGYVGRTTSTAVVEAVVEAFRSTLVSEGFHVIEHVLLRLRTTSDRFLPVQLAADTCDCVEVTEPYSFIASVVLPSWPRRFRDLRFRKFVEETLRREAPAHVYLKICWISHVQMKELEITYTEWTERLAKLDTQLGGCRFEMGDAPEALARDRSGQMPLPASASQDDEDYGRCLARLIEKLHGLVTVYPLAQLHDCEQVEGDAPQVTLNNTSLGTF